MADREVLLSGWLQKQGHVRRNWTERYFVLGREGYSGRASLYYYKSPWKVMLLKEESPRSPMGGGGRRVSLSFSLKCEPSSCQGLVMKGQCAVTRRGLDGAFPW